MIKFTPEVKEKTLKLYKSLSLKNLRKRQDLCRDQLNKAFNLGNDDVFSDMQTMDKLLTEAIDYVAFEKRKAS
jgi:hypothetical protein